MKRFILVTCLLLLVISPAVVSAALTEPTTPQKNGGSIYFETDPPTATIWLNNTKIGTSPFTYYSEQSGIFEVRVTRKGYEEHRELVTVGNGERTDFYARLTPIVYDLNAVSPTVTVITTATTMRKSTMTVPTSWPTTTPATSPLDSGIVIAATALATGLLVI